MNEWMVADALPTTYNGYSTYESECVATRKPRFISLVSTLAVIGGEIVRRARRAAESERKKSAFCTGRGKIRERELRRTEREKRRGRCSNND